MDFTQIEDEVKQKPYLLAIPVGAVVIFMYLKGKSSPATGTVNSTPGTLNDMSGTTGVDTSMLQNAMQALSQQEESDIANVGTEIAGLQQQIAQNSQQTTTSIAQAGQQYQQQIQNVLQQLSQNKQSTTNIGNLQTYPALQAINTYGYTNLLNFFKKFSLPDWIAMQWAAENPQQTTLPSQNQLEQWLNAKGYRNPATGAFTNLVSVGQVPAAVEQEYIQAFGKSLG